jgi:hypothetical protein
MLLGNSLITAFYRAARPSQQAFQSHTKDSRPFREYSGIPGEIRIIAPPALAALQQLEKQISARTTKVCFEPKPTRQACARTGCRTEKSPFASRLDVRTQLL